MRVLTAAFALLAACSPDGVGAGKPQAPREPINCLALVWAHQEHPDWDFDTSHDGAGDDAISCATLTSPAAFARTLKHLRIAAAKRDRAALVRLVDFPLTFIDGSGVRSNLSQEQLSRTVDRVFSEDVIALLSRADLSNMRVIRNKGAMLRSGAVWLSASQEGADPKIVTINRQVPIGYRPR